MEYLKNNLMVKNVNSVKNVNFIIQIYEKMYIYRILLFFYRYDCVYNGME